MDFILIDGPRPHIAQITLNRPERMNAMAFDVMIPLREALEQVGRDNDVRAVIVGVELTKRMLWSSLDAASLSAHMDHEGLAQLYVRMTTGNFEEAIIARKEKRTPTYRD